MKVKVLARSSDDFVRETKKDIQKVPRNYNKDLHHLEASREYVRAVNAAKLERVFAKPFFGSLDGHKDAIGCIAKHPHHLSRIYTGACDGEIRIWDLARKKCINTLSDRHSSNVRGIAFNPSGEHFFSCDERSIVNCWKAGGEYVHQFVGESAFFGLDHHWSDNVFATCGSDSVQIWDEDQARPKHTYLSKGESIISIRFNPVEMNYMTGMCADRGVVLYDIRHPHPIRKTIMEHRSNHSCWNPMEPLYFTVANEDYNLYTFDMRKMASPVNIHMGHIGAVLDVDYSPTGREFVSGSADKTIRIFPSNRGNSRDVYHTKRMQRVVSVKWTFDSKFILSASDEMNLRIWKANASEKLGLLRPREKEAFNYNEKLKKTYAAHPQVGRILKHRHVPNAIYQGTKEIRIIKDSQKKKEARRRSKSKPGDVPYVPERKKVVVREVE